MRSYQAYVEHLKWLLRQSIHIDGDVNPTIITDALNGGAGAELRRLIDLDSRRSNGAFFTGSHLAKKLIGSDPTRQNGVIFDPACGAGDLLLSAARELPILNTADKTLRLWGSILAGRDIHREFVQATKIRLALLALERGVTADKPISMTNLNDFFAKIKVGNAFSSCRQLKQASIILLNPPYTRVIAPAGCNWASGKVSNAAIFLDWLSKNSPEKTLIKAILPDVLRAGSNYKKWREEIKQRMVIQKISPHGIFDSSADVDVFLFESTISNIPDHSDPWTIWETYADTVGAHFDLSVGSFVPFRENGKGPWRPFVDSRGIHPWEELAACRKNKRSTSRTVAPPFVVLRRNSRPDDKNRATGSILRGKKPILVENHLVVCKPKDGKLKTCRQLLKKLKRVNTSNWLNLRLRCRHLTISSVREIPW